jgi:hypothetical protein
LDAFLYRTFRFFRGVGAILSCPSTSTSCRTKYSRNITANNSYRFIPVLQDLVAQYRNTPHTSLKGMIPQYASNTNVNEVILYLATRKPLCRLYRWFFVWVTVQWNNTNLPNFHQEGRLIYKHAFHPSCIYIQWKCEIFRVYFSWCLFSTFRFRWGILTLLFYFIILCFKVIKFRLYL